MTGAGFLTEVLQATIRNTKLGGKNTVLVKDVTMYDGELTKAVANLNADSQRSWPDFGYVGSIWCGNAGASKSRPQSAVTLNTDDFKLTLATARNDLAFLKETVTKGEQCGKISLPESEPWKGMTWAEITTRDFLITKNGELFVRGKQVACLRGCGHFKTGQEAKSLIESGGDAIIPYKLDASSRVVLKPKRDSTLPQPLQQFNNTPAPWTPLSLP